MVRGGIGMAPLMVGVIIVLAVGTIAYVTLDTNVASTPPSTSSVSSSSGSTSASSSSSSSSVSTGVTGGRSTSATSVQGLDLRLAINATRLYEGQTLQVNITEYNGESQFNNVTKSDDWQVDSALGSCPNTDFWPFGLALYSGHYGADNVSTGTQLQLFPVTPCPLFIRLITGYYFQPQSDLAQILPGNGTTVMSVLSNISGIVSTASSLTPLSPGSYTLVGADEWGTLTFLYFEVAPPPPS